MICKESGLSKRMKNLLLARTDRKLDHADVIISRKFTDKGLVYTYLYNGKTQSSCFPVRKYYKDCCMING